MFHSAGMADTLVRVGIKMIMTKQQILDAIRQLAHANGEKPPGERLFATQTGTAKYEWYPNFWLRWSDALVEAGYTANQFTKAIDNDLVIQRYVGLMRELNHVPIEAEMIRKHNIDKSFPTVKVFRRFGGKQELLEKVLRYCRDHDGHQDVVELCTKQNAISIQGLDTREERTPKIVTGFVYLMRSGRHHKIGRSTSVDGRARQLAIIIPVPPTTIHSIETDDPTGVEAYWHRRFADKRGEGEWFDLSPDDIKAFKRWRRIG